MGMGLSPNKVPCRCLRPGNDITSIPWTTGSLCSGWPWSPLGPWRTSHTLWGWLYTRDQNFLGLEFFVVVEFFKYPSHCAMVLPRVGY